MKKKQFNRNIVVLFCLLGVWNGVLTWYVIDLYDITRSVLEALKVLMESMIGLQLL